MVTARSAFSSVTLRPSTITGSSPSRLCSWLAMTPPPWTRIFSPPREAKSEQNLRSASSLSIMLPPIFTTVVISLKALEHHLEYGLG